MLTIISRSRPDNWRPWTGGAILTLFLTVGSAAATAQVSASAAVSASSGVETAGLAANAEGAAESSSGPIRGPVLGYVLEGNGWTLRPIMGIPGSSHLGDALDLGRQLQLGRVSPRQDYLIGVEVGSSKVQLFDLRSGLPAPTPVSGADTGIDRIVLSPRGSAAALYDREAKRVQILTGLPSGVRIEGRIELGSLPGILTALAVNDEGDMLAAGVAQEDSGSLYVLPLEGPARAVAPAGRISAVAFLEGSNDLLAADYARHEIVLIRDVLQGAHMVTLATQADGLVRPVAVAAAADGRRAFAASYESGKIVEMPLQGGAPRFFSCNCKPAGLERLGRGAVFQLTQAANAPLFLLDAGQPEARIVVVPPLDAGAPPAEDPEPAPRSAASGAR